MNPSMGPPQPLSPPGLDLRDFRWMKLDLIALFNSDFNATPDDTAWRAGVTLWGKAWHQVPAGSLPDDDPTLCNLSGLGRDLKTWRRIRAAALRGFTPCSDGRLYHSFLCRMAIEADAERRRFEARRAKDRDRKKADGSDGIPPETPRHSIGIPAEISVEGEGQVEGESTPLPPDGGFARFWSVYPHKVEDTAAREALDEALHFGTLDEICSGAARYAAGKPKDQHWQKAHLWLRKGRWRDQWGGVPVIGQKPSTSALCSYDEMKAKQAREAPGFKSISSIAPTVLLPIEGQIS